MTFCPVLRPHVVPLMDWPYRGGADGWVSGWTYWTTCCSGWWEGCLSPWCETALAAEKGGAEFPYLIEITMSPEIDGGDDDLDLLVVD